MGVLLRLARRALLPILCVGLFESRAVAQEQGSEAPRAYVAPFRLKLHAALPLSQVTAVNSDNIGGGSRGVTLAGGSVEAEFYRSWAVELGGNCMAWLDDGFTVNYDAFARGGFVPVVFDGRNLDGLGWTIQFDALAGYRWLNRTKSPDAHSGSETTHAVRGNLGLDFTRQGSRVAFVVRVLSGLTLPVVQTHDGNWASHSYIDTTDDFRWATDIGIDIGVALSTANH